MDVPINVEKISSCNALISVPVASTSAANLQSYLKRFASQQEDMEQELHNAPGKMRTTFYSRISPHCPTPRTWSQVKGRTISVKFGIHILCTAAAQNETNVATILLNRGISPNCFDDHKRTPLHLAVSKGHCEMVKLLLRRGADPNRKDGLGNSCLHLAACANDVDVTLLLIKGGARVNSFDIRGRSPIQLAQSKLRILQQSPNIQIKSKVTQIIDMLILYLEQTSKKQDKQEETELLSSFQNRLQISDTPEQISDEIGKLSDMLTQLKT